MFFYGVSFGSLSASMLLIQYFNKLYRSASWVSFLPMVFNLVIPALGVYLFVKGLMLAKLDKPITMGKALFLSLTMSLIMGLCNIAAYQHIYHNKKDIISDWSSLQYTAIEKKISGDVNIAKENKAKEIQKMKENFDLQISPSSFGSFELMMCISTGMVVALLVFVWNYKHLTIPHLQ